MHTHAHTHTDTHTHIHICQGEEKQNYRLNFAATGWRDEGERGNISKCLTRGEGEEQWEEEIHEKTFHVSPCIVERERVNERKRE